MKLKWYRALLCDTCGAGKPNECTTPGCVMWVQRMGLGFGSEYTLQPLTDQQVDALNAGRWFERGGNDA